MHAMKHIDSSIHITENGRSKGALKSPLEEVEGLGAKKIQSLLRHFGGMKGIEHATIAELALAPGIGKSLAARIYEHLHG